MQAEGRFAERHVAEECTPAAGDRFTFTSDPLATIIEAPVIFAEVAAGGALAYTSNVVNSLVDGENIVVAATYGPEVDLDGAGPAGPEDILNKYTKSLFERYCGYTNVVFSDVRTYHNASGEVHCATNVRRVPPVTHWWELE